MSYCRFSEGDVYAYACEGGVQFWVAGKKLDRLCNTYDSAYQYAKYLRDECGLDVPSYAIDELRLDALDEAYHGDGSAVKELISENAKLRELYAYFLRQMRLAGCFDCFSGNCEEWGKCHGDCTFERCARELGIEVKDD